MSESYLISIPFHFFRDFRDSRRCYIGIKKSITTLDLIDELFTAAKNDFPALERSQVSVVSTKDNDPFVIGICFETHDEIPEKYHVLKFLVKTS